MSTLMVHHFQETIDFTADFIMGFTVDFIVGFTKIHQI